MSQMDMSLEHLRPRLGRLAYRMLGSTADADEVVQEAYLRWIRAPRHDVQNPEGLLYTIVTRLCIDRRRSIEVRKEMYIGPWLPEPIVEPAGRAGGDPLERAESISMAILVLLENLTPLERAAYLLRRTFDMEYREIAEVLEQSESNVRQLVSRAEARLAAGRPRFEPTPDETERITTAFLAACAGGDFDRLAQLLAGDAVAYTDGGGKALAALAPICGADRIARFFVGLFRKAPADLELRRVLVNGQPGVAAIDNGEIVNVLTLDIVDGRIAHCFVMRNPEKLPRAVPR